MAKWIWGLILIALVALGLTLVGPWNAKQRSVDMKASIEQALAAEGINANVDMIGNAANLSGEMPSQSVLDKALSIAKGTTCKTCGDGNSSLFKGKADVWHKVSSDMTVKPAPKIRTQSPYTFNAVKAENGVVTINGFVGSEESRQAVLADAKSKFNRVRDNKVKIAAGAPNASWDDVIKTKLTQLRQLDKGTLSMRDQRVTLTGMTSDEAVHDAIEGASGLPTGYQARTNIELPVKQIETVDECQVLFDELKGDNKVNFASAKAELVGNATFDLLNSLVKGAEQCSLFKFNVVGHTDSQGKEAYNQWLSESRANSVVNYLVTQGVAAERITAQGLGETKPIASNQTSVGRAANRRIEFIVTQ